MERGRERAVTPTCEGVFVVAVVVFVCLFFVVDIYIISHHQLCQD